MTEVVEVSAETARRFVLGKHGLWPERRWAGKGGARAAIRAMEHLQLDPLVIVARSHDLMLHSRVEGYQTEYFDELTYKDREFFDWGGWLAVRPMEELPYWRVFMHRGRKHGRVRQMGEQHAEAVAEMRARLQAGERIANRDLASTGVEVAHAYRGGKEGSQALYYLWRTGEAMTYERRGFERLYAAAEAVAPAALLVETDEREAERFLAKKAIAADGIGRLQPMSLWFTRTISRPEQAELEQDLVDRGDLARVRVQGRRRPQLMLNSEVPLLEAVAAGGVPEGWVERAAGSHASFLSPLDPLVARGRATELFGVEHVWEIYKRPAEVKYGRYTMPILYGDRIVGRMDSKYDRATKTLVVNGLWFEDPASARDPDLLDAIASEFRRLLRLLGAERLDASAVADSGVRKRLSRLPA